jgi:predicted nucleotidyltransferase
MDALTPTQPARLGELCRHYHVRRLELSGSGARADFNPAQSDLDFLLHFNGGFRGPSLDDYCGLKAALEALLGRPVDLIMPEAMANPYLQANIARDSTTLYAA